MTQASDTPERAGCTADVLRAPDGVVTVDVWLKAHQATVQFDESPDQPRAAIEDAGYAAA